MWEVGIKISDREVFKFLLSLGSMEVKAANVEKSTDKRL